jgi:hypothetical protein
MRSAHRLASRIEANLAIAGADNPSVLRRAGRRSDRLSIHQRHQRTMIRRPADT